MTKTYLNMLIYRTITIKYCASEIYFELYTLLLIYNLYYTNGNAKMSAPTTWRPSDSWQVNMSTKVGYYQLLFTKTNLYTRKKCKS